MSVPKHLNEAVARLREASARIEAVRQRPLPPEGMRQWLEALSDCVAALADIQSFNNESVHEKLHLLAARVGVKTFPGPPKRPPTA